MTLCYHGTNFSAARSILKTGFRDDTWFAKYPVDARAFGGPVIFIVSFPKDVWDELDRNNPEDAPCWQFHLRAPLPSNRILAVYGLPAPTTLCQA